MSILPDPAPLFALLNSLGVPHETVAHPPTRTVAESRDIKIDIPGGHTKNLFLKDKKGAYALVTAHAETPVALKSLHPRLGMGRLSFASEERLRDVLNVPAGSVTPFALMHDAQRRVLPALDRRLLTYERINVHPLRNDKTTSVRVDDLIRFIEHVVGSPPMILDLSESDG